MDERAPNLTPLRTALINDNTMPASLLRSFARLYAAAWRHNYRHTPALDFESELLPLLGLRRTQARQHLRLLRVAKLIRWTSDGNNHYVIYFSVRNSEKSDSVVGGVYLEENLNQESMDRQHTTTQSEKTTLRQTDPQAAFEAQDELEYGAQDELEGKPGYEALDETQDELEGAPESQSLQGHPTYQAAVDILQHVGVWRDAARRIASQLVRNEQRGHAYLPGLADVLGWIAYCFADGEKNRIAHPVAVLAANLNANRRCPQEYRPAPLCARCGCEEDYCQCEAEPTLRFPPEFLERALHPPDKYDLSRYAYPPKTFWGVCTRCHALPCQC